MTQQPDPHAPNSESSQAIPNLCERIHHDNGIDEYVIHAATRAAVDAWIALLEPQLHKLTPGEMYRQLFDTRVGIAPVSYTVSQISGMMQRDSNRNPVRTALIYDKTLLIGVINSLVSGLRISNFRIRYFTGVQRDEAIAWLLSDK